LKQTFVIKDFKVFEEQQITFKDLTVLAGSNSVGKSTIIQAILLSRTTLEDRNRLGKDVRQIPISLNGPYHLELGDTYEVIRRGKRLSESTLEFSLIEEGVPQFKIILSGDRTSHNRYELWTESDEFLGTSKGILGPKFYYLSAERIGPRLKYEYEILNYLHAGYRGEHTFQVLSGENLPVFDKKLFKGEEPALLFDQTRKWLDYIIPGASFDNAIPVGKSKVIEGTYGESLPTNVGFGISYVLPIIVNGLLAEPSTIMIVENPEAHLHPSGQSRIGRFLAQIAGAGVQLIIETHSEHVINGLRLAILDHDKIDNENAIINYMHKDSSNKTVVREINFDDEAEFDRFPPGFIDQEQRDLAEMIRLIKLKKNESKSAS
jgi:predicted ATPase